MWNYASDEEASMYKTKRQLILTQTQLDLLSTYGFQKTQHSHPEHIENNAYHQQWVDNNGRYLGYHVTCNQDDVMDFLVYHKIPFTGCCHYGTEAVFYTPDDPEVIIIDNPGKVALLYRHSSKDRPCMQNIETLRKIYGERVVRTYQPEEPREQEIDF